MGDQVILESVEVIQRGLLQLDFKVAELNQEEDLEEGSAATPSDQRGFRCFVDPGPFFELLGAAFQRQHDDWCADVEDEQRQLPVEATGPGCGMTAPPDELVSLKDVVLICVLPRGHAGSHEAGGAIWSNYPPENQP